MHKLIKILTLTGVIATTANLWGDGLRDPNQPGKFDCFHLMIIGRYFESAEDFINAEMINKKYRGMTDRYEYNPIPIKGEITKNMFKGIKTQHIYSKDERKEYGDIVRRYIYWYPMSYAQCRRMSLKNNEFKNVVLTENNRKTLIDVISNSVVIPEPITLIDTCCFSDCSSLISINLPSNVSKLGDRCFRRCSMLTFINIPSAVSKIGSDCFSSCKSLTSITIPSTVSALEKGCFSGCSSLISISIPGSVSSLGDSCFSGCSDLLFIDLPLGISRIGDRCFKDCRSLSSIMIPMRISKLGSECFSGCCRLTSIIIPTNVSKIGDECFWGCTILSSISIPRNLQKLINNLKLPANANITYTDQNIFSDFSTEHRFYAGSNVAGNTSSQSLKSLSNIRRISEINSFPAADTDLTPSIKIEEIEQDEVVLKTEEDLFQPNDESCWK